MMNPNRGSEWRKWDLHLHTPFTQKNDQFTGKTEEEKWDNFYNSINTYISDGKDPLKAISAIAITDYLSIDNYRKVCDDKRLPSCIKLILPNVEMRSTPIAKDTPLNIHCIFSERIVEQLADRFFAKLKFHDNETVYSATKTGLIRLGRNHSNNENLSDDEAYNLGLEQYVIPIDTLIPIFKDDQALRNNTIIIVSNSSNDGASGVHKHNGYSKGKESQLDATRRKIYQFADMIYSANPKDRDYFLGDGTDDAETIKRNYRSLMPCIHGSDAHNNDKIFEPDEKRYCWIKAEPTFEGLKQILFEPEGRVRIQELEPENDKSSYNIIDSIHIQHDDFVNEPIYFNKNLNVIIGGRSSGKSLLLHLIANTANTNLMSIDNTYKSALGDKYIEYIQEIIKETTLTYKNTEIVTENTIDTISTHKNTIEIMPQGYMSTIISNLSLQEKLKDLIKEDTKEKATYLQEVQHQKEEGEKEQKNRIDSLYKRKEKLAELKKEMEELGTKENIEQEIKRLQEEIKPLLANDEQKDIKQFNNYKEEIKKCIEEKENAQKRLDALVCINKNPMPESNFFLASFNNSIKDDELKNEIIKKYDTIYSAVQENWNKYINEIKEKENAIKEEKQIKIEEINNNQDYIALKAKIQSNEHRKQLMQKLEKEENQLKVYKIKEEEFNKLKEEESTERKTLIEKTKEMALIFKDCNMINFKTEDNTLAIETKILFDNKQFETAITSQVHGGSKKNVFYDNETFITTGEEYINKLDGVFDTVYQEHIKLKSNSNYRDLLEKIFGINYFYIHYNIKYDNDDFEKMSQGKKAIVFLKLILDLEKDKKYPLLIDQPEDDLDNRSIYTELVDYIKNKKIERQIFIVTHNANLVLGTDAEQVIVANQHGVNSENKDDKKFQYISGAIESTSVKKKNTTLESKDIKEHICEILEGGNEAFYKREKKYSKKIYSS